MFKCANFLFFSYFISVLLIHLFRFVAGHPRNDLFQDNSFSAIEKYNPDTNSYDTILTDNDWETEFEWIRTNIILGESEAEIRWFVPEDQESGVYRIAHYGAQKNILKRSLEYYSGVTNQFEVIFFRKS